ncbi:MAG TPA: cupin domain-containing protein [Bryobacteraceae bacterium]|nr:cupin domain-containing protein [Bryobacteraceae bacterium]
MKKPRTIYFAKGADVPNSPLPALIFPNVLEPGTPDKSAVFRKHFRKNGWSGLWTDTIFDYTHYHSNAHEVLGIAEGKVTVRVGGEQGRLFRLKAGDMLLLPAGVGHRRVGDDKGLEVIGAYPRGQSRFDLKRKGRATPKVPLPKTDPFYGEDGPLMQIWSDAQIG